jgi:predicted signal transduction protein with EAL and GGDEF domain
MTAWVLAVAKPWFGKTSADGVVRLPQVPARIASAFEAPLALHGQRVDLSAGLGIACGPAHASDAETLHSRAEVAVYAAKHGKRGAQWYEAALHSGALCGAAALARWQHPQRGLVPPVQFIPSAEQMGCARQLTLGVFEAAARQQARAEGFCLGITEGAIMDDVQRAKATLERLAALGCDEAQGYHLSKPVPLAQLQDWAARRPLAADAAAATSVTPGFTPGTTHVH